MDLLERKYKDEKLLEETRQEVRLAWDEQRQLEERSKVENEMQRRKNLADSNWIRQKKKVSSFDVNEGYLLPLKLKCF